MCRGVAGKDAYPQSTVFTLTTLPNLCAVYGAFIAHISRHNTDRQNTHTKAKKMYSILTARTTQALKRHNCK